MSRAAEEEFMPKQPRKPGRRHHAVANVNNKEPIFDEDPEAAPLLEDYIEKAKSKFDFELVNYAIMGNHVHFLIEPGEGESISRIMQWILGCFAQAWNRLKGKSGHFWGGRFWSRPVGSDYDMAVVFSYISQNRVKAGKAKSAADWKYGGAYCFKEGLTTGTFRVIRPGKYKYLYYLYYGH
jgi:putative transposase